MCLWKELSDVVNDRRFQGAMLCPGLFRITGEVAKVVTASIVALVTWREQSELLCIYLPIDDLV